MDDHIERIDFRFHALKTHEKAYPFVGLMVAIFAVSKYVINAVIRGFERIRDPCPREQGVQYVNLSETAGSLICKGRAPYVPLFWVQGTTTSSH
jgi:hypothetical protein